MLHKKETGKFTYIFLNFPNICDIIGQYHGIICILLEKTVEFCIREKWRRKICVKDGYFLCSQCV